LLDELGFVGAADDSISEGAILWCGEVDEV